MSKARRRRKGSTALAIIASAPFVAGVTIQELGAVPPPGATSNCQNVLSTDIPECMLNDFTTTCSAECQSSVAGFASILLEACSAALTSTITGPLFSSSNGLLLCGISQPDGSIPLPNGAGSAVTTTITATALEASTSTSQLQASNVAPVPPSEPLPLQQPAQAPPQPIPSVVLSSNMPPFPGTTPIPDFPTTSALLPVIIPPSSNVLPPAPVASNLPPVAPPLATPVASNISPAAPLPTITESVHPESPAETTSIPPPLAISSRLAPLPLVPQSSFINPTSTLTPSVIGQPLISPSTTTQDALLPTSLSTTAIPTISIIAGPALIGGQLPGTVIGTTQTTLQNTFSTSIRTPNTPATTATNPAPSAVLSQSSSTASQPSSTSSTPTTLMTSTSTSSTSSTSKTSPSTSSSSSPMSFPLANGGIGDTTPTAQQMRAVNPSVIGGIVGGGLAAIAAATALIYFLGARKRNRNKQRDSGRRPISSWDFIDGNRNVPPSQGSDGSGRGIGKGSKMGFLDQPVYYDQRMNRVPVPPLPPLNSPQSMNMGMSMTEKPREVVIKRTSGPPVVVRSGSNTKRDSIGRIASGLDDLTVEALSVKMKSAGERQKSSAARSKYTASQYSNAGSNIINVGYDPQQPMPDRAAFGSPGPTVYRGSNTTVGVGASSLGGGRIYGDGNVYGAPPAAVPAPLRYVGAPGPQYGGRYSAEYGSNRGDVRNGGTGNRYPSPIDEVPEVPMPRRSTFYDPFMGAGPLWKQGVGYNRM